MAPEAAIGPGRVPGGLDLVATNGKAENNPAKSPRPSSRHGISLRRTRSAAPSGCEGYRNGVYSNDVTYVRNPVQETTRHDGGQKEDIGARGLGPRP